MTDAEFMEWWNECRWDKTGTELDAWPREKLKELQEMKDLLERVQCCGNLWDVQSMVHNWKEKRP